MRVVVLWRDDQDYSRSVAEWLRDLERRCGKTAESISPDEPEGDSLARAYDVVEYPSILAIDGSGQLIQLWRGRMLPKLDDVAYYLLND